jgi:uncharacterized membrane protein YhaH (DUF805 family)
MGTNAIFINYRRSTTAAAAGRLHDRLEHHFPRQHLFMDVDAIEPGLDFVRTLNERVNACQAFIAVIGPNWASVTDAAGRRRLDSPDDYVRLEIEAALKRDIRVIPVLVDGAQMPAAMELPPSLRPLTHRQAIELSHARFALEVDLLANAIKRATGAIPDKAHEIRSIGPNASLSLIQILFGFRGRIARATYWKGMALLFTLFFSLGVLLGAYFILDGLDGGKAALLELSIYDNWRYKFLVLLTCVPFYWPYYALIFKRLHDIGHGWQLFSAVVLASLATVVVVIMGYKQYHIWFSIALTTTILFLGIVAGQPEANRFGPDPSSRPVRDTRSITSRRRWRRLGAIVAGTLTLLLASVFVQTYGISTALERIRSLMPTPTSGSTEQVSGSTGQDDFFSGARPGEWVLYSVFTQAQSGTPHFFKPASIVSFGDRRSYQVRYGLIGSPGATATQKDSPLYEEAINVIDCTKNVAALAERTVYNRAKEAISHFKWGNPESLDMSSALPITPGSAFGLAELIVCDEHIRTPLLQKDESVPSKNMKYLSRMITEPFADVYYGFEKSILNSVFGIEMIMLFKNDVTHSITELVPNINVLGLPNSRFMTRADIVQLNCTERKIRVVKMEFYDSANNLLAMVPSSPLQAQEAAPGSIFTALLDSVCGGIPNTTSEQGKREQKALPKRPLTPAGQPPPGRQNPGNR